MTKTAQGDLFGPHPSRDEPCVSQSPVVGSTAPSMKVSISVLLRSKMSNCVLCNKSSKASYPARQEVAPFLRDEEGISATDILWLSSLWGSSLLPVWSSYQLRPKLLLNIYNSGPCPTLVNQNLLARNLRICS